MHVDGERSYKLARAGKEVKVEPREVVVNRMELRRFESPEFDLFVHCGKGTYIRQLVHDLALSLGSLASTIKLTRLRQGPFEIATSLSMDQLTVENIELELKRYQEGIIKPGVLRANVELKQEVSEPSGTEPTSKRCKLEQHVEV